MFLSNQLVFVALALECLAALPLHADSTPPDSSSSAAIPLVPWPRSLSIEKGQVPLTAASRIVAGDASLLPLANILSQEIELGGNLRLKVASGTAQAGDIVLYLDPALKGEAYTLHCSGRIAEIQAANYAAAAMGTVTLLQSLTRTDDHLALPAMTVSDGPQSAYCGTMVDVARRYNSIDSLKQIVIMCRLYKIRFLHLHMTDDQAWTIPSRAFPQLGKSPQFLDAAGAARSHAPYTIEELTGLVKFADDRGVTIVPEIEMPGHSGSLQRDLPEIFGVRDPKTGKKHGCGVLNLASDAIYPALDTLIGETCDIFKSSPYFHMGSDECYWPPFLETEEYKQYAKNSGLTTPRQMAGRFAARINEMVKKRGKRLISWESYGGTLDKDVIIMAWRAGHDEMIKKGYQIINVPWVPQAGYTPRANFEWSVWSVGPEGCKRPTEMPRTPEIKNGLLGAQQVLWEQSGDNSLRMLRLTAPARNEQVYNPYAGRSYADFKSRMTHTDALLDKLAAPVQISVTGLRKLEGVPLADVSESWGPNDPLLVQYGGNILFNNELTVTLTSLVGQAGRTIRYTLDGSVPTADSQEYAGPFTLAPTAHQLKQAQNGRQPRIDMTIRAGLFADKSPIGFARVATYSYNVLEHMPQTWKFTLYQADAGLKNPHDDLSGLRLLYRGTAATMLLNDMRQFNYPPHLVSVWEGTAQFAEDADYNFKLRSFAATSRLFIDGKLLVDRTASDWGQDFGKVHLSAGRHAVKVVRCGAAGYQSLNLILPDQSQKPLDLAPVE